MMKIPSLEQAQQLLTEAGARNPGPWIAHSRHVADAARRIAERVPGMDGEAAYIAGLLHDIGRREGVTGMRHVLDGYRYLSGLGYEDAARISITHSFANGDIREIFGEWDCDAEELAFIRSYLAGIEFKWRKTFEVRASFERRMGCSVYDLLPGVIENTFKRG